MATPDATKKQIPVDSELFSWPSDDPRLIAARCKSCGYCSFPKIFICGNPDCKDKRMEDILLSKTGVLRSWTTQYYPPPEPFMADKPYTPYALGLLEFPEGIQVAGIITGYTDTDKELSIGIKMEVISDRIYTAENGDEIIGWKFRPVKQ